MNRLFLLVASISMLYKATGYEHVAVLIYLSFSFIGFLAILGILVFSPNVYYFLAAQRE